jgi:hypothetical protein
MLQNLFLVKSFICKQINRMDRSDLFEQGTHFRIIDMIFCITHAGYGIGALCRNACDPYSQGIVAASGGRV